MQRPALILLIVCQIVNAAGGESQPNSCFNKKGYYFCNHNDISVKKPRNEYSFLGWCCPLEVYETGAAQCNEDTSTGIECTLPRSDPNDQGLPLYMTYWPGHD
jgi:hypothetical protein